MKASVLVVGGAGYIGSHMVKALQDDGCEVTVFDNLSRGHHDAVSGAEFVHGDLLNANDLASLFGRARFELLQLR